MLSAILNRFKLVYGLFGQSNMHRSLNFWPKTWTFHEPWIWLKLAMWVRWRVHYGVHFGFLGGGRVHLGVLFTNLWPKTWTFHEPWIWLKLV